MSLDARADVLLGLSSSTEAVREVCVFYEERVSVNGLEFLSFKVYVSSVTSNQDVIWLYVTVPNSHVTAVATYIYIYIHVALRV